MADPIAVLAQRFSDAIERALGADLAGTDPVVRPSAQPQFGDLQVNAAMALAKRVGRPPRDVAQALVDAADVSGVATKVEIAGPGFINVWLDDSLLDRALTEQAVDPGLGVAPDDPSETVVVDYSSPNLAKEMHVGHLRSTIIGDALVRVLDRLGHRVIRQNHVGDWGTQFGLLCQHLVEQGIDPSQRSLADLNALYQEANARQADDPAFAERARDRVVLLQSGDPETVSLWQAFVRESMAHADEVYRRLGVLLTSDDLRGESAYEDVIPDVVAELDAKGLTVVDDGALCVFPPGFAGRDGEPMPLLVRKADGGYLYATTDLAGVRFRAAELGATRLVYVVGSPQAQHLAMVFAVAEMAGWLRPGDGVRAEHVQFGSVLGPDGKMFKTRSGENVKLAALLDEAVERAAAVLADKAPHLGADERASVARAVGIGAVKYADLSSDRVKDYVFDFDRMLAFEGNTGPYLQYAHARIRSIFRKAAEEGVDTADTSRFSVADPAERALALSLAGYAGVVHAVGTSLQPHRLCTYLFDLAQAFTAFYERCPVLRAGDDATRASRLSLCDLTARVLADGLGVLGIEAPERM